MHSSRKRSGQYNMQSPHSTHSFTPTPPTPRNQINHQVQIQIHLREDEQPRRLRVQAASAGELVKETRRRPVVVTAVVFVVRHQQLHRQTRVVARVVCVRHEGARLVEHERLLLVQMLQRLRPQLDGSGGRVHGHLQACACVSVRTTGCYSREAPAAFACD
jgi:hypothetical protein